MQSQFLQLTIGAILMLFSFGASAALDTEKGKITTALTDSIYYGKCMIGATAFVPSNNCPATWVSLDCEGNFNSKPDAARMWDAAQMAFALDATVDVLIDDAKKLNGICVATRLEVTK